MNDSDSITSGTGNVDYDLFRNALDTSFRNDFNSGKALRQALVEGTLSPAAEYALIHKSELRRGLLQHPLPDDVRDAIVKGTLKPNLRLTLLAALYRGVSAATDVTQDSTTNTSSSQNSSDRGLPARQPWSSSIESNGLWEPLSTSETKAGNTQPVKKFTAKRTNVPRRANSSSVVDIEASSSVSKAPFVISHPSGNHQISPQPARVVSDIITQSSVMPRNDDMEGSISGILRNPSPAGQGLKRKHIETLETDKHSLSETTPPAHLLLSLGPPPSSTSSGMKASALEVSRKSAPSAALATPLLRSPGTSKPALSQTQMDELLDKSIADGEAKMEALTASISHIRDLLGSRFPHDETQFNSRFVMETDGDHDVIMDEEASCNDHEMKDAGEESEGGSTGVDAIDSVSTAASNVLSGDDGRPYDRWRFPDGQELPTSGVLLPTGYYPNLLKSYPWLCPVRSCQSLKSTLVALGKHFITEHNATELNDNGDGSFSIRGYRLGGSSLPAIVVSKQPPDLNETEGDEELHSASEVVLSNDKPSVTVVKLPPIDVPKPSAALNTGSNGTSELDELAWWRWKNVIHPHLKRTPLSPIPTTGHVRELMPLSQKRDVEFNPLARTYFETKAQDISAIIIQITGQKATSPCQRCQEGRGPFVGCIVISPEAPLQVRRLVTSCANCFYKGCQKTCGELTQWHRKTYPELRDGALPEGVSTLKASGSSRLTAERTQSPVYRSTRLLERSKSASSSLEPSVVSSPAPIPVSAGPNTQQLGRGGRVSKVRRLLEGSAPPRTSLPDANNDSTIDIPMEDWENAPGRIRNESSAGIENIAFSAAYLAHGEEVAVGPDIGFHVLVIKPGTTHRFQAVSDRLRLCSIAVGKVKVKVLNQEFMLGPNGMFQVKPNWSCIVENRLYVDATLHITGIPIN